MLFMFFLGSLSYRWELIHSIRYEILTERVAFHCGESLYKFSPPEAHKGGNETSLKKNTKLLTLDIHAFGHDKTIITKTKKKSLSTFIY